MKKLIVTISILCLVVGTLVAAASQQQRNQRLTATDTISITVSPKTMVIGSETVWVTVHTNIALSRVDCSTLTLNGITVAWTKADAKGNLVAKFHYDEVEKIVSPPQTMLTLKGVTKDGTPFEGSDTVAVRNIGRS